MGAPCAEVRGPCLFCLKVIADCIMSYPLGGTLNMMHHYCSTVAEISQYLMYSVIRPLNTRGSAKRESWVKNCKAL